MAGIPQFTRAFDGARDDDSAIPRFYLEAENIIREGASVYQDVEMVEVIMPGNMLTKPVFRVTDKHRERWPNQYKAFKLNLTAPLDGTPLEEWPILRPSQILELKSLGFRTIQHVANMSDHAMQRVGMGGQMLRNKAKAYLSDADAQAIINKSIEDAAKFERLSKEKDEQIARLNQDIAVLGEQVRHVMTQQQMTAQNTASTPNVLQMQQPSAQPIRSSLDSFATSPATDIRSQLAQLSEATRLHTSDGVQEPFRPPAEHVTIAPSQPVKRRGRPPKNATLEAV